MKKSYYLQTTFLSVVNLAAIGILLTFPVSAQSTNSCSEILRYGIFDVSAGSKEEYLAKNYLLSLKSQNISSTKQKDSNGGSVGVNLFGVGVGGDIATEKYVESYLQNGSSTYLDTDSKEYKTLSQYFKTANPTIINAWSQCVQSATAPKGLIAWTEPTGNSDEIILKIEARERVLSDANRKLKLTIQAPQDFKGRSVPSEIRIGTGSINPIFYKRAGCNGGTFIITTKEIDYSGQTVNVDQLRKLPCYDPKAPPCNPAELKSTLIQKGTEEKYAIILFDENQRKYVKKLILSKELLKKIFQEDNIQSVDDCIWNLFPTGGEFLPGTEVVIQDKPGTGSSFTLQDPATNTLHVISPRGANINRIPQDINDKGKVRHVDDFKTAFPNHSQPTLTDSKQIDGNLAPSFVRP